MTRAAQAGIIREARRPPGWQAPGPRPAGAGDRADLAPAAGEDLCFLTGDWRIFQRIDGHRWSLDDLVTAHAATCAPLDASARILDLGCGIGSVLMMIAWRCPDTRVLGIEAQSLSAAMARRSLAYNGAAGRVEVRDGDLRDPAALAEGPVFALVTGTPPYFPRGAGLESPYEQRGPCRFEHRGGVEDYCAAAARALGPGGRFVMCAPAGEHDRVAAAAAAAGLSIVATREVIPRTGKPALIEVATMTREPSPAITHSSLVVRDAAGEWTPDFLAIRQAMGLPPPLDKTILVI